MKKNEKGISLISLIIIIIVVVVFIFAFGSSIDNKSEIETGVGTNSSILHTTKIKENRSTYIPKCTTIDYITLARNPNQYKGKDFTFTGEVIQVMDGYNNNIELRVNVTPKRYEYINETYYENTIYATYQYSSSSESRILEDDIITLYGRCEGLYSYISVMGAQVTLPSITAMYIDIRTK